MLEAAALPKIEAELKSRAATIRQDRVGLARSENVNSLGATVVRLPPGVITALRDRQEKAKATPRLISISK
jgi:hypothetical protein